MTKLLITGANGRMGQALIQAGKDHIDSEVSSTHDIGQDLDSAFEEVDVAIDFTAHHFTTCLLYTSPSPRDQRGSRMPSSA